MLSLVVDALASYRLTRLVVEDDFPPVKAAREEFLGAYDEDDWPAKLVTCPWCAGFWIAVMVVFLRWIFGDRITPLFKALAFSAVTGIISERV